MDTHVTTQCCTDEGCVTGLRNNYFPGKKLTPNSFSVEQRYHRERRKLINRSVHGWGVVYGFGVTIANARLAITTGLAFDRAGRELLQEDWATLELGQLIALDDDGNLVRTGKCPGMDERIHKWPRENGRCWLLSAHYAERELSPVNLKDPCSCSRDEWNEVCETVRYSLRPVDCDECCKPFECGLDCDCATGRCCGDRRRVIEPNLPRHPEGPKFEEMGQFATSGRDGRLVIDEHLKHIPAGRLNEDMQRIPRTPTPPDRKVPPRSSPLAPRGGCRCLCDESTRMRPGVECEPFTVIDEACGRRVRVDLKHGVPLACIGLAVSDGCHWSLAEVYDDCGRRRLVKRNDMLFDLIEGCDLTRIEYVGWEPWHRRRMSFDRFQDSFGKISGDVAVAGLYTVMFSKPVRLNTVRADAFDMTIVIFEHPGAWGRMRRVPIVGVQPIGSVTDGLVQAVVPEVDARWVEQQIRREHNDFTRCCQIEVEIRLHGDYVIDCNNQRIDGSVPGLRAAPTGRVKSGGDLFSSFTVDPPDEDLCRPCIRDRRLQQGA